MRLTYMCRETNVPIGWSKTRHVLLLPGYFDDRFYRMSECALLLVQVMLLVFFYSPFILLIEQRGILLRMRQ